MAHVVITGAQGGNAVGAPAPNRLEINDFVAPNNIEQFSLFVQALTAVFETPQPESLSFFGISGIHGLPYSPWEGAGGNQPVEGSDSGGYCTHGSVLFPTWHRPYVALYEQALQQAALGIAQQYADQDHWTAVARNLRVPFWDWASSSVPPDEVIALENVNIITPDGNQNAVPNPFLRYSFNPIDPSFTSPWDQYQTTVRHPEDQDPVQGLKSDLASVGEQLTTKTYNLLSRVHTWPAFSNHTPDDGGSSSNSLEAIHDEIHVTVGGNGHMSDPAVAAFDPIFYLHHCNVDRLLSLWSAVNPGRWVTRGPSDAGTFTIPANVGVDVNTDLTPFWNTQNSFWISTGTTTTAALQYTYPEFNNLDLGNANAVRTAIANIINQKYRGGSASGRGGLRLFAQPPAGGAPAPTADTSVTAEAVSSVKSAASEITHLFHSRGGPAHTPHTPGHGGNEGQVVLHDYTARVHFKKYELGGSFSVLIFLGDVPNDPSQWRKCNAFVGAHHAFVNSAASQCGNCKNQADIYSEGFVHLNSAIAKRSGLSSYEAEQVLPYLKDKLHWRIQAAGKAVEVGKLPSLEVTVSQTPLTQEPGAPFPTAGQPIYHHHITYGRPGGARHAQA
jgi:tyrosinase